ncbi:uncharacterized protein BJX67DRAFT_383421 [Aspergillus lucknowensis]|uniref:Uncharacterized protein n=1 Tax=Aspergillus lucknowensis TaxID=176173 RepID=A0ABR4LJS5_9EURO
MSDEPPHYPIPAQYPGRLGWIQFYLERGYHTDFQGCWILITAKHLKDAVFGRAERVKERYGYGWFLDNLDYCMMTFRPLHCMHMVFSTRSLLSWYYARYQDLVTTKQDYILFHDILGYVERARGDLPPVAALLNLLVDLCLGVF